MSSLINFFIWFLISSSDIPLLFSLGVLSKNSFLAFSIASFLGSFSSSIALSNQPSLIDSLKSYFCPSFSGPSYTTFFPPKPYPHIRTSPILSLIFSISEPVRLNISIDSYPSSSWNSVTMCL